jgi:hypothetical protein|tara:strand:- start:688 stop:1425 length:738 start_codon:yes stop_codon:yes gene_type:complete
MGLGLGNVLGRSKYYSSDTITRAVLFDGTDDIVTVSDDNSLSFTADPGFGISMWLNLDSSQSSGVINKDEEYNLHVDANGRITWLTVDDSEDKRKRFSTSTSVFDFDQWNHVYVELFDNGNGSGVTPRVFYNGSAASGSSTQDPGFVDLENTSANLLIGKATSGIGGAMGAANTFMKGKIANLAFIQGGLTSTELADVYGAGRTGIFTEYADNTLAAYYRFGDDFTDSSDNSNTGSASGTSFVDI